MDEIRFDGRVVVITGSGEGLGKAYALAFAKRGARVVVNDIPGTAQAKRNAIDAVVEEIKSSGGDAVANYDSVTATGGGENIIKTAVDAFGKVDILINNAGIIRDKSLSKMSVEDWDDVLSVHLKGAFCVTQAAFNVMRTNNYGRIVNTTSGAGLYGNFGQSNYCSAKMGLIGLMGSVAIEGAKYNIKCNAIAPVAATKMTENLFPKEILEKLDPAFIAPLVLYLASEENKETKKIFNCAAGWYSRSEILCSPGVCLGDGKRKIQAEEIRDNWKAISNMDLEKARPLANVIESFSFFSSLLT